MGVTIVMFPGPLESHSVPMIELSNRLLRHHADLNITILLSRNAATRPLTPRLSFIELPYVEPSTGAQMNLAETLIGHVDRLKPVVADALASILNTNVAVPAFVVGMFGTTMIDVAADLGVPAYIFFTTSATGLGVFLHLPVVDSKYKEDEWRAHMEGIDVAGLHMVPPLDFISVLGYKQSPAYTWFLNSSRQYVKAQGIIVNSFNDLETKALEALAQGAYLPAGHTMPSIYPVGPLLGLDGRQAEFADHPCIKWLDGQPNSSIVFLCFGGMGTFSTEQAREIALGLELSGHGFLWSLRVQSGSKETDLQAALPDGFLERTKSLGLVWTESAPQVSILAHPAVGGFVTHCGWNSVLETMWFGVPMVGWPLYAEQRLNAFVLAKELGILCGRLKKEEDDDEALVEAKDVGETVRRLMEEEEGRRAREKTLRMKELGRKAVEEGGSSYANLALLVNQWTCASNSQS
ncbi:anthocyanidin 3-O-glucosyltransferase 2-like [Nymphaea colorata]|nr:anthocyanidin 3-O-glucosyltransferase 2-like [Nymphaea colorata]